MTSKRPPRVPPASKDDAPTTRPRIRTRTAIWLIAVAAVSCGIVGLLVLAFDSPSSLGPSPAGTCTVGYTSSDVRMTFSGTGAATMCTGWHSGDATWHNTTGTVTGDTSVCTGRNGALSWTVLDDGPQTHGRDACAALSQWAQGGSLLIP
jgi:hypothetical protein